MLASKKKAIKERIKKAEENAEKFRKLMLEAKADRALVATDRARLRERLKEILDYTRLMEIQRKPIDARQLTDMVHFALNEGGSPDG